MFMNIVKVFIYVGGNVSVFCMELNNIYGYEVGGYIIFYMQNVIFYYIYRGIFIIVNFFYA